MSHPSPFGDSNNEVMSHPLPIQRSTSAAYLMTTEGGCF